MGTMALKPKRQVTGKGEVKAPEPPKAEMRQFGNAMEYMIDQMAKRWRNHVFEELNQSTIKKFADAHAAQDAAQVGNFARVFLKMAERVRRKLLKQFDDGRLEKLAKQYTGKVNRRNKAEFYRRVEKRVGISRQELEASEGLTFQINAYQLETYQWIRKLRDDTLQQWTSNTLRDMAEGRTLPEIMEQFEGMKEKRKNHAKMVARTQIATFNSLTSKARAQTLGITKAVWVTSKDERVRASHRARDGEEFDLDKGLYSSVDGEYLLPGTDYQCFPGSVKVNHSSLCRKLYRRWYAGELTELVRDDGVILRSTPNHPILTVGGFKAAGEIDVGDHIIGTFDQGFDGVELNGDNMVPTFEELFSAVKLLGIEHGVAPAARGNFHGDVSDGDIDVVALDGLLMDEVDASIREKFAELNLSFSDQVIVFESLSCLGISGPGSQGFWLSPDRVVSLLDLVRSRLLVHLGPLELFRFALGAWACPGFKQSSSDGSSVSPEVFSDSVFAMSVLVHGLDAFDRKIELLGASTTARDIKTNLRKLLGEDGRMNPDLTGGVLEHSAVGYKACRVVDKRSVDFSGHVYNLETESGDYIADSTAVSNCRCDYRMVIPSADDEQDAT